MIDINVLRQICIKVREAAYNVYLRGGLPVNERTPFPAGTCGWVSVALGSVLATEFPEEMFFYVRGYCGEQSHAWIQYYDYVIDITADQFEEVSEEISIVQRCDSRLHTRFSIEDSTRVNDEFLECYLQYKEESLIYKEYFNLK